MHNNVILRREKNSRDIIKCVLLISLSPSLTSVNNSTVDSTIVGEFQKPEAYPAFIYVNKYVVSSAP